MYFLISNLVESSMYFPRTSERLLNQTVSHIDRLSREGKLQDGDYNFLCYLIGRNLPEKDLRIITLSLFGDGLATVSFYAFGNIVKPLKS